MDVIRVNELKVIWVCVLKSHVTLSAKTKVCCHRLGLQLLLAGLEGIKRSA